MLTFLKEKKNPLKRRLKKRFDLQLKYILNEDRRLKGLLIKKNGFLLRSYFLRPRVTGAHVDPRDWVITEKMTCFKFYALKVYQNVLLRFCFKAFTFTSLNVYVVDYNNTADKSLKLNFS